MVVEFIAEAPLISLISLAMGNKGLIVADGLRFARPGRPFTLADTFVCANHPHPSPRPTALNRCLLLH